MTLVSILTCWSFALAQWQTVVMLQDEKGYGVVKLQETGEQVHIGFKIVDGEQVCYIVKGVGDENTKRFNSKFNFSSRE